MTRSTISCRARSSLPKCRRERRRQSRSVVANAVRDAGPGAALPDLGPRRSQRDVGQRRQVDYVRPQPESLRPHRRAYGRISRCARCHRPLHLHHAQAAYGHVRRAAGKALSRLDGNSVLRRHHLRRRRLRAVDAQAEFRRPIAASVRAWCAGSICTTWPASCW